MNQRIMWLTGRGILVLILVVIGLFRFTPAINVEGGEVLAGHSFPVQFSAALNPDTVTSETVYVTDSKGERVLAGVELSSNGKTLRVTVEKGEWQADEKKYTLHLANDVRSAYGLPLRGEQRFSFSVQEELPRFTTDEELRTYIEKVASSNNKGSREMSATEEAADFSTASGMANGHSQTNNQVSGVFESDIVQTDGEFIYQATEEGIKISNIKNPSKIIVESTIAFEKNFYASDLFLAGDMIVVIGNEWQDPGHIRTNEISMMPTMGTMTIARVYDVTDRKNPKLFGETGMEGNLVSSRMVDGHLYYITTYNPMIRPMTKEEVSVRPLAYDGANYKQVSLDDIARIPNSNDSSYTVITAVDVNQATVAASVEAYVGAGGQMYMSKNHLYLAANVYKGSSEETSTDIYKFALNGMEVPFVASASVTGTVLNQFSMDEHEENFRIATTEGQAWGDLRNSKNHVFILDGQLNEIGHIGDLAPEERIYSARFMDNMIYMVTFREMDPLFVIDATDPTNPEVLGELKIPGVSTYLHPIDENHLIGFGMETKLVKPEKQGTEPIVRQAGMKISVFDVTDFHNPKEKFVEVIGGEGTYSELMHNHKALTVHPENPVYAFPIHLYNTKASSRGEDWTFDGQGAMVYKITPEGIEQLARLVNESEGQLYESYEQTVQRSVYANGFLFTLLPGGVRAYDEETYKIVGEVTY
ncbi:beta-propeller domain-containing protein [Bacillus solitudinis]|uniref:beta-propeller domain-containing protein n=1 Tax=Bacillus solitudinis TaxID=2014074 RepID=UPI000C24D3E6|nr:beta-propeller domain-containing protein [Bacillus solitudinis]